MPRIEFFPLKTKILVIEVLSPSEELQYRTDCTIVSPIYTMRRILNV